MPHVASTRLRVRNVLRSRNPLAADHLTRSRSRCRDPCQRLLQLSFVVSEELWRKLAARHVVASGRQRRFRLGWWQLDARNLYAARDRRGVQWEISVRIRVRMPRRQELKAAMRGAKRVSMKARGILAPMYECACAYWGRTSTLLASSFSSITCLRMVMAMVSASSNVRFL